MCNHKSHSRLAVSVTPEKEKEMKERVEQILQDLTGVYVQISDLKRQFEEPKLAPVLKMVKGQAQ